MLRNPDGDRACFRAGDSISNIFPKAGLPGDDYLQAAGSRQSTTGNFQSRAAAILFCVFHIAEVKQVAWQMSGTGSSICVKTAAMNDASIEPWANTN